MGLFDDPQALKRLDALLDDSHPDARFDAAIGLARHGNVDALPVLREMLDTDQTLSTREERPEHRAEKAKMVNVNGLRAIAELARTNPQADLSSVEPAVEKLAKSNLVEVKQTALEVRRILQQQNGQQRAEAPN